MLLSESTHVFDSTVLGANFPPHGEDHRYLLDEVERILHSEELRGSEVLRRLLRFLAEKSVSGEADELKEYIVAIEGLGKPASYDPRHNSGVRIQVGRLRQKLADYYRTEGVEDPVVVDIPKGRFKLNCQFRDSSVLEAHVAEFRAEIPRRKTLAEKLGKAAIPLAIAAGMLIALGIAVMYNASKPAPARATSLAHSGTWNADMEELWLPFIATNRTMIVAIEDPLFLELDGRKGVYYRNEALNTWSEIESSQSVEALHSALKTREMAPSRYYTTFGEVEASVLLAKLLGPRVPNLVLLKTSDLSMPELADNNVVFVGVQNRFFNKQMQAAPVTTPLQPVLEGIRNLQPGPNEPAVFADEYSTAPAEEGIAYALVTHLPGPLGSNDMESFTSSRAAGYVAAVKAFTDPIFARTLVSELKRSCGGKMPHYYQVLLKVKFTDQVPTKVTFVLARQLHYSGK